MRTGVVLVLVSAAAFGAMAVLAKLAYAERLNTLTLLLLRFTIAAAGMWLLWWGQYRRGARVRASFGLILPLVAMGALGYVGQSFAYFSAAARLPAAATGLLLFTYPILVTLLARLFFKEALTPPKLAALVVSTVGTLLVLGIFTSPAGGPG